MVDSWELTYAITADLGEEVKKRERDLDVGLTEGGLDICFITFCSGEKFFSIPSICYWTQKRNP